jgi:hypothetical protein
MPGNKVVPLDRGQRDVMDNMARDYPTRMKNGGQSVAERLASKAAKRAFHKAAVLINPSFAELTCEDVWTHAGRRQHTHETNESAADGLGGAHNTSPITLNSSRGAKKVLEHLELCFNGLFHAPNGGMLINVGTDLNPSEKCMSMWKSLRGTLRINGSEIQSFARKTAGIEV